MNFLNSDVPDPTDFPPNAIAPGLRDLDGSFRCDICGDLYDAPVTIVCGHCFCSAVSFFFHNWVKMMLLHSNAYGMAVYTCFTCQQARMSKLPENYL
jgi:hypothetical protein